MSDEVLIIYTWHDIERTLLLDKANWPQEWLEIEMYSRELVIYVENTAEKTIQSSKAYLKQLLKQYYTGDEIVIKTTQTRISVLWEKAEERAGQVVLPKPLFKEFLYANQDNNVVLKALEEEGVPVTAFHSYKGGVGRTLSLITFVRNMIEEYQDRKRVLIVDSDIEAPGLTWLGQAQNGSVPISYLDILSIIGAKGEDDYIIENISHEVEKSVLTFQTDKIEVSQYFLPTYRKEEQLFDIYANPERIMAGESNKYIIVDVLSRLGAKLGVDMVLVDLRAGISEYSAPFLFDPRVSKFFITSTSNQSVYGTHLLLQQIGKQKGNGVTNIFLTMVMKETFRGKERDDVYEMLLQGDRHGDGEDISDSIMQVDTVVEIEKSDKMIHLGNLSQICENLNSEPRVTEPIRNIVLEMFRNNGKGAVQEYDEKTIAEFKNCLHRIATENVTAEGADYSNLLATKSVLQLGSFNREIPKINVLGAKGSGKTYLYKQMLSSKNWDNFLKILDKKSQITEDVIICPVLCSEDRTHFQPLLAACRQYCIESIPAMRADADILSQNERKVRNAISNMSGENEWQDLWDEIILGMFQNMNSWSDLDAYLDEIHKKVIFLVDGLETLFRNVMKDNTEKSGIRALCRGLINRLYEYQIDNAGIIIFVRKDIAELAVNANLAQFRDQYQRFELTWSQRDALMLAWKMADRAAKMSGVQWGEDTFPLNNATRTVLEKNLTRLWGKKMGSDGSKNAITVRWVLASLSDFNGQLQARDIVRFLKFATADNKMERVQYYDRFLTPEDMRKAVKECSDQKLEEVEQEIHQLKNCFQILREVKQEDKQVPLNERVMSRLGSEDQKTLERYGYLKEADGEYYIPESVRYALGYNKSKRGGIKLVSLLVDG
ncbi:MAG TPA: hypothetical protein DCZ91_18105 [Lachnospiraceae bacterium]|nr:hypothetical protein [Lachnospiraceae bacterium]